MISVIMATYREEEYMLRAAIESVLKQSLSDFEFIIVLDDPDCKEHRDIIEEYASGDWRIHYFVNEENMGLTASLNKALSMAKGDYVARMDADDIALPDRFQKEYDYLTQNDYDLVGGITEVIDEDGKPIYAVRKVPTDVEKIRDCLQYSQVIAHPTWFGRIEVFDDLGGYREIPLCEDTDFTLRAALKGYLISNVNEPVLQYRLTSQSVSRANLYEQFLYLKYITKQYSIEQVADIEKAKDYVQSHWTQKEADRFLRSNMIFNRMLRYREHRQYGKFIVNGFRLLAGSKPFLQKIYRFIRLDMSS